MADETEQSARMSSGDAIRSTRANDRDSAAAPINGPAATASRTLNRRLVVQDQRAVAALLRRRSPVISTSSAVIQRMVINDGLQAMNEAMFAEQIRHFPAELRERMIALYRVHAPTQEPVPFGKLVEMAFQQAKSDAVDQARGLDQPSKQAKHASSSSVHNSSHDEDEQKSNAHKRAAPANNNNTHPESEGSDNEEMLSDFSGHTPENPHPTVVKKEADASRHAVQVKVSAEGESQHTASEVIVERIAIDRLRRETQYGKGGQKDHTVSFSLMILSLETFAGQSADHVIRACHHMAMELLEVQGQSADVTHMIKNWISNFGLDILKTRLPMSRWGDMVSAMISVFIEADQKSMHASYAQGKGPGGEGVAINELFDIEERLKYDIANGNKVEWINAVLGNIVAHAISLLDVRFHLSTERYIFALRVWYAALARAFPHVMRVGPIADAIRKHVGDRELSAASAKEEGVKTVGELLAKRGGPLK